jgi:predicted DNA-binding transcriptional regulator AlpA
VSPDLARILEDPPRAAAIPVQDIPRIILELAAHETAVTTIHRTLISRLLASPAGAANSRPEAPAADHGLTPHEAATRLGVTVPWLYRNHQRLPFAKKLSRKCLRFSEVGLEKWLATKGTGQSWK